MPCLFGSDVFCARAAPELVDGEIKDHVCGLETALQSPGPSEGSVPAVPRLFLPLWMTVQGGAAGRGGQGVVWVRAE